VTILVTIAVVLLVLAGGLVVRQLCLARDSEPADESAVAVLVSAWILGIAVAGVAAPLAALAHVHAAWGCAGAYLVLGILAFARRARAPVALRFAREDAWSLAAGGVAAVFLGILAFRLPFDTGDEVVIWGFKAAAMAETGRLDPTEWPLWPIRGFNYPVAIPAIGSIPAAILGRFEVESARVLVVVSYLGFALALGECLRPHLRGPARALATAGLATLPAILGTASQFMADAPFTAAVALAALHGVKRPASPLAWAHVAALATLRVDGPPIALGIALVILASLPGRARWRAAAGLATALALACVPWGAVLWSTGALSRSEGDIGTISLGSIPSQAPVIASHFAEVLRSFGALLLPPTIDVASLGAAIGSAGYFGFAGLGLALLALGGAEGADPPLPRARCAAMGVAIVVMQALPLAFLAIRFEGQLAIFRERAVFHCLPALVLAAHAARLP
jgi:hypothetical protein